MAVFNQFRTVVLDRAIVEPCPQEQLVILGAGLDGRVFRLPQLRETTVFEVDHPGTQRLKRQRAAGLSELSRELRYVEVDFAHDDLVQRLEAAGHKPDRPTFWLWEGVTMYLARGDIARTLARLTDISAPGSRLALTYLAQTKKTLKEAIFLVLFGLFTGEPIRSRFSIEEMDTLVGSAGWETLSNNGIEEWERDLCPAVRLSKREVGIQWDERIWVGRRRS